MKSHTNLFAQQTRLGEWANLIRDCQTRPQGMKIDEWCLSVVRHYKSELLLEILESSGGLPGNCRSYTNLCRSSFFCNPSGKYGIGAKKCCRVQKGKQPHFGNHRADIFLISKYTFGSAQGCSTMVPDSKKYIWRLDLWICAEGLRLDQDYMISVPDGSL